MSLTGCFSDSHGGSGWEQERPARQFMQQMQTALRHDSPNHLVSVVLMRAQEQLGRGVAKRTVRASIYINDGSPVVYVVIIDNHQL